MSDDLVQFEAWIGGLLAAVGPRERRRLAAAVARDLRRANAGRIAAQTDPDGRPFVARKRPLDSPRNRAGRIRRRSGAMFQKLRKATHLRTQATADEASIGFLNAAVARIARVHHEGGVDKVTRAPDAPRVRYAARRLIGLNDADRQLILDKLLAHLTQGAG